MKCFNDSKDVVQPQPGMLCFRHVMRPFVFLLLPRKLEWQQQKGINTRDECRDQMCQESFSHSMAADLKRRNKVVTHQMGRDKLLMAHSKRIARICEICLVVLKGRAKGRGQNGSGRYKGRAVERRGHEGVCLSVKIFL